MSRLAVFARIAVVFVALPAAPTVRADDDATLSLSARASRLVSDMTEAEKLSLLHGGLGAPWGGAPKPPGAIGSAGYVPGVPRLNIPALQETDAELGVANPGEIRRGDRATAMPSNLALASTWDADAARRQGEAVAEEARTRGFNVLLGGAANLIRDPRGGRDFEYFSEDPLLSGVMAGEAISGAQSRHVLTTLKHFALNDQETDRVVLDVRIDPAAARESDLLAFEIALERGHPGAVMCAYNKVDGAYSCENPWLLRRVLKEDWRFPGFVMSDWGAAHSTVRAALAGLDQESGEQLDTQNFFARSLARAVAAGAVPRRRLDDMARRILTSMLSVGLADPPADPPADPGGGERLAADVEREGAVLLKNDGVLPLGASVARIAVIGGHADRGVASGGGSSQVLPRGPAIPKVPRGLHRDELFDPSSPLLALRRSFPSARVDWADGRDPARAAALAAQADVAIVFAEKWMAETADAADLGLGGGQDRLIARVAAANPKTVVVLETGGPVAMPWLGRAAAVLEAWYPGQGGGEAIVDILAGVVNPSGRLPVTFPLSLSQLPHPRLQGNPLGAPQGPVGRGGHYGRTFVARYDEGALVGYKWFAAKGERALFPFGFGLSYTRFSLGPVTVDARAGEVRASVAVTNEGERAGAATPQFYLRPALGRNPVRLLGWSRVDLKPGEQRVVTITADPRLLGSFDEAHRRWNIRAGSYRLNVGFDAEQAGSSASFTLPARSLAP